MAAGDLTQGRRRPDGTHLHELEPGDYAMAREGGSTLWICLPNGVHGAVDYRWALEEDEKGAISVQPLRPGEAYSIQTVGPDAAWHGYLERGVWREV